MIYFGHKLFMTKILFYPYIRIRSKRFIMNNYIKYLEN